MSDIYFNPLLLDLDQQSKTGNKTVTAVFIIISVLVLITGCTNFVILTTAKATQRAHEVAMRKVVGARFKQLLIQFLGESILLTFIAFLFAVAITELTLPFLELIIGKNLMVPYSSMSSYIFVLLSVISVGLFGGLYPALVLSRFLPVRALKVNQTIGKDGSYKLRNVLVVFQFTASITLIIATVVAIFQLHYTNRFNPGFNPDNLLVVEQVRRVALSKSTKTINTLKQELIKLPSVTSVGSSNIEPRLNMSGSAYLKFRLKAEESAPPKEFDSINGMYVDYDFFKVCEIPLVSGRYFTNGMDKEESGPSPYPDKEIKNNSIIINLEAAKQAGYTSADDAIGKILESIHPLIDSAEPPFSEYTIIGVVADSQYRSLRAKPKPEVYHLSPHAANSLILRYNGDYQAAIEGVKGVWNKVVGDIPFIGKNLNYYLATTFSQEEKENKVLIAFALLSVFIACMGLFGMASFTVDRRVKEIGLRKVMGAKVKDIVNLLGWNFLKPVIIANIIAWPVAIFAMQSWLERFPYRFNPLYMIPICLVSGFIALLIAWFTVAGNTKRVARTSPIHSLRYE